MNKTTKKMLRPITFDQLAKMMGSCGAHKKMNNWSLEKISHHSLRTWRYTAMGWLRTIYGRAYNKTKDEAFHLLPSISGNDGGVKRGTLPCTLLATYQNGLAGLGLKLVSAASARAYKAARTKAAKRKAMKKGKTTSRRATKK